MATQLAKVHGNSRYTPELAREICSEIASTSRSLQALCAENDHWPALSTIFNWLNLHEDFQEQYARAKELQADLLAEEMLEISDDDNGDAYIEYGDSGPVAKLDGQSVQRSRLRVDTRKWLAGKMRPKKYGDKLDLTSGGDKLPAPAPAIQINVAETRVQAFLGIAMQRKELGVLLDEPTIDDLMS